MSKQPTWHKVQLQSGKWVLVVRCGWFDAAMNQWLDEIQTWSSDAKLGRRISYDMWEFKTEEELTLFLLRWA